MTITNPAKNLLRSLAKHFIACILGFALGVMGWVVISRVSPKHYTGSALLAERRPLPAILGLSEENLHHERMASQLQQVTARLNWVAISEQYRPYPSIQATSGLPQAAAYLASQVSIQQVAAPNLGGEAIRISYGAKNRDLVLGVIDAVADGFAKAPPIPDDAGTGKVSAPVPAPVLPVKHDQPVLPSREQPSPAAPMKPGPSAATLSSRLQASLAAGEELQQTLRQNTAVLMQLHESLQKLEAQARAAAVVAANPLPEKREYKPSAQEEQLKADVAQAQRVLAELKTRYTDEYPEVVAAKDRVRDLHLDLDRIIAASNAAQAKAAAAPQPKPEPQHLRDTAPLLAQIDSTEAFQTKLQQDIAQNQNETSRLQAALAKAKQPEASHLPARNDSGTASQSLSPDSLNQDDGPPASSFSSITASSSQQPDPAPGSTSLSSSDSSATAQDALQSPFFLVSEPTVTTRPAIFAESLLWPVGLVCGLVSAFLAIWIAERVSPSIRNERMLHRELPPSAVYLGGIPRIKHEVISD